MRLFLIPLCAMLLCGCVTTKPMILTETEMIYLIPENTPFNAQTEKNGPLVEIQRTHASYVMDAGKLISLQEQANKCVLSTGNTAK